VSGRRFFAFRRARAAKDRERNHGDAEDRDGNGRARVGIVDVFHRGGFGAAESDSGAALESGAEAVVAAGQRGDASSVGGNHCGAARAAAADAGSQAEAARRAIQSAAPPLRCRGGQAADDESAASFDQASRR